jgi:hypothetical protein
MDVVGSGGSVAAVNETPKTASSVAVFGRLLTVTTLNGSISCI